VLCQEKGKVRQTGLRGWRKGGGEENEYLEHLMAVLNGGKWTTCSSHLCTEWEKGI
jgi:hypothetical protein